MASIIGAREVQAEGAQAAGRYVPFVTAALAAIGILLLHYETVRTVVAIWVRSETFAHGFIVVPIALWLAWRERHALAAIAARPFPLALAGMVLAGMMWVVMSLADVQSLRQFALLFMVQGAIVAVLGWRIARAALLPIVFLLFAVPTGEFLLPILIEWTADFTVAALQFTGVPVFREANHFVIPSGAWSVVEACSGLRYLIASLMIGVVFAEISYRSRWRKLAFVAAAIVVPLVANWLRAYMIVMIGHLSNNRLAVGVDHLIYGWLFFGVVMALLFWGGSYWTERRAGPGAESAPLAVAAPWGSSLAFVATGIAAVAIAGAAFGVGERLERAETAAATTLQPVAAPAGFAHSVALPSAWVPGFQQATAQLRQGFVRDGVAVGLHVSMYANQVQGRELVASMNHIVAPSEFAWRELSRRAAPVRFAGNDVSANRSLVSGAQGRIVIHWVYWVDGHVTADPIAATAWLAWARLRGRPDVGALVAVFAAERDAKDAAGAVDALSPAVDRALRSLAEAP